MRRGAIVCRSLAQALGRARGTRQADSGPGCAPRGVGYSLNSSERGGELLRGCLYGLGNRNGKMPIPVQDVSRTEHRQANDAGGSGRIADDVALWRLLAHGWLGRADMQVEHVAIGVVVGVIRSSTARS